LSLLDLPNADDGIAGGKLGILDNNTTGRFLKQEFTLETIESDKPDELVAGIVKKVDEDHVGFVILDVPPQTVLAVADALKGKPAQVINAGSPDDALREENCRANVKHTPPTRTMLADALAQYLAWKQWRKWFLVVGPRAEDKLLAFLGRIGQDPAKVKQAMNSFGVQTKAQQGLKLAESSGVDSVPQLTIAGRWRTGPGIVGAPGQAETVSGQQACAVADFLIKQARGKA
jgi:ABC transporter substrate binding protein (PQQ-dependent alcohol dehydrogenase system)